MSTPTLSIKKNQQLSQRRINSMLRRIDVKDKVVFGTLKQVHSDEKRVEAVNAYLIYGNMKKVSEVTGIAIDTLRDWRKYRPWWKELEDILKEEHNAEVAGELTSVVEKTIAAIHDRVRNGDYLYNPRTGEVTRVPVKASDLNKIANTMIDKKLTLQKQPTKYSANSTDDKQGLENKLDKLAKAFSSFTSGHGGRAAQTALNAVQDAEDGELLPNP